MDEENHPDNLDRPFPGVNNTRWRRALTLSLLWFMGGLRPNQSGVWVKKHFVIKHSIVTSRAEVEAMQLVSQHTTIPVPKIYCAFERLRKDRSGKRKHDVYIMMQRMPGETLLKVWPGLTDTEKTSVSTQLRGFFNELRSLLPPRPRAVGSALSYGPITDVRWFNYHYGPYNNLDDFHAISGRTHVLEKDYEGLVSADAAIMRDEERYKAGRTTRFTHGDLNSLNFLYKDGKITAVLDWGCSGWLPDYWEYTQSWQTLLCDEHWWKKELGGFLDHYPHDLKVENIRRLLMDQ